MHNSVLLNLSTELPFDSNTGDNTFWDNINDIKELTQNNMP